MWGQLLGEATDRGDAHDLAGDELVDVRRCQATKGNDWNWAGQRLRAKPCRTEGWAARMGPRRKNRRQQRSVGTCACDCG